MGDGICGRGVTGRAGRFSTDRGCRTAILGVEVLTTLETTHFVIITSQPT